MRRSLAIAPGVVQDFELEAADGKAICSTGEIGATGSLPLARPGEIRVRISPVSDGVALRVGVNGGMATAVIPIEEVRTRRSTTPPTSS